MENEARRLRVSFFVVKKLLSKKMALCILFPVKRSEFGKIFVILRPNCENKL